MSLTGVIIIVWLVLWFSQRDECPTPHVESESDREERKYRHACESALGMFVGNRNTDLVKSSQGPQTREEAVQKHTCKIPGCAGLHRSHP